MRALFQREKVIIIIALLTFLLSAGYAFLYRIPPSVDASAYDQVGWNIAQGHGFRLTLDVPIEQDEVITYQGPAYQFFLAGIYTTFGHHREAVWIAQALLRALCVLMLYAICKKIFREQGHAIGWLAGGVFGFYPDLVEIGAMLMTETFFIFLTVLVLWLFFREYDKPTPLGSSLLGAGFGVAILGRSIILLFAPVLLWWFWRRKAWIPFFGFAIAAALVLTPWTIRNWNAYGKFIPTMANSGYNLWVGNRHGATGEGGNPAYMQDIMKVYGMTGTGEYFTGEFKTFVREHPLEYAQLTGGRFIKYFSFIRPMGFWFYQSGFFQWLFILSSIGAGFMLFSLSFSGILLTWIPARQSSASAGGRERNEALRDLSLFAFFTAFAIIPIIITTRYRLPIYPILSIFAAFVVMRTYRNFKETIPFVLGGTAIVLLIAGIDFLQFSEKIFGRIRTMFS
jgi:4-amino-4-deoxy-L-arabinose transferase-like glycosyltransferase